MIKHEKEFVNIDIEYGVWQQCSILATPTLELHRYGPISRTDRYRICQ